MSLSLKPTEEAFFAMNNNDNDDDDDHICECSQFVGAVAAFAFATRYCPAEQWNFTHTRNADTYYLIW